MLVVLRILDPKEFGSSPPVPVNGVVVLSPEEDTYTIPLMVKDAVKIFRGGSWQLNMM